MGAANEITPIKKAPAREPLKFDATAGLLDSMRRAGVFFGGFDQRFERGGFCDGKVSEDFAVHVDAGFVQAVNEAAICEVVLTDSGVNTLDPKGAELALL